MMPLLIHKDQPKWKYYLSCHFVAVSSWLIVKDKYLKLEKINRIDFWFGIGSATWAIAILSTIIGFFASDYLNKNIMIGLAIVNPIYFICMMIDSMKTIQVKISIISGSILGPIFYNLSQEWCVLFGGFIAGTIAYIIGEKDV